MDIIIENNKDKHRFETTAEGHTAFVDYKLFDGGISFLHTEVPPALEGKGIASALAKHVLDYAKNNNLKTKIYCSFLQLYIKRHPEYQDNVIAHS